MSENRGIAMLQELYVENFALIDKLRLTLTDGMNVISGETGAGKSLLLDAVSLLIGGRASEQLIRDGAKKCLVEGIFSIPCPLNVQKLLLENGFDLEDEFLIISREYFGNGRSNCRINGRGVNLSFLRQIGRLLINIHGQMDHMLLLDEENQLELLDNYGGEALLLQKKNVSEVHLLWQKLKKKWDDYQNYRMERAQRIDWLKFQINEIEEAAIDANELAELEKEKKRLLHGERLIQSADAAFHCLNDSQAAIDQLSDALSYFRQIADLDEEADGLLERFSEAFFELEDISRELNNYQDNISVNPYRLEEVDNRLVVLYDLIKKYGADLPSVLLYCQKANCELDDLLQIEEEGSHYQQDMDQQEQRYYQEAAILSNLRQKAAENLAADINEQLKQLYMPNASIKISLDKTAATVYGLEKASFLISSNQGEKYQPVSKIASGGELARVILAIKVILADLDQVPTLIFDEVDSGLGGKALSAVARKMAGLGEICQVLCVTHGPLMAASANHQLYIYKENVDQRTLIRCRALNDEERVYEIARMIAGEQISEATLLQAREMLSFN